LTFPPSQVRDLAARGLWDDAMRRDLMAGGGSVQAVARVPDDLKALYKTAWELSQKFFPVFFFSPLASSRAARVGRSSTSPRTAARSSTSPSPSTPSSPSPTMRSSRPSTSGAGSAASRPACTFAGVAPQVSEPFFLCRVAPRYYLRTKPAANALQFTLDPDAAAAAADGREESHGGAPEVCLACSG